MTRKNKFIPTEDSEGRCFLEQPEMCPKCGSSHLDHGVAEFESESIYYPYTCRDCGCDGKEWYSLTFAENIED